jgi:fatty-acyl-CoA synthase
MIEEALMRHPAVGLAAAVGQPDEHAGELPVAYVTLRPGASVQAGALLDAARELVPERAAIPVRIEVLERMPLTPIGKLAKADLRLRAATRVMRERLARDGNPALLEVRPDARRGMLAVLSGTLEHCEQGRALLGKFAIEVAILPST